MDDDIVIDIDGLRHSYGRFEAVRGVSLRVRRGELFALLGTNGAGKTTAIEVMAGLQRPSEGRVRVFGMDPVVDRARVRRRTGMMLQDGGLAGQLTVRETIDGWRALTARARATEEVADLVQIAQRLDVAVEQLSGGERRRLELALAVMGRPELLFLDEPTTGMDPTSRRRTWEVVQELQRAGTTVLLTTHYLEEAEALADRIAIMHTGRIVSSGTPGEVVAALPARISYRIPFGAPEPPPLLPNADLTVVDGRATYRTRCLQTDVTDLLAWANRHQLTLPEFTARSASLEDLFIHIDRAGSEATA